MLIQCSIAVSNVDHQRVTSDLLKCVEDSLRISAVGVQGFDILSGDDRLFELLQPRPHEPSEDEGVSLHTQPFPRTTMVQLCLHMISHFRRSLLLQGQFNQIMFSSIPLHNIINIFCVILYNTTNNGRSLFFCSKFRFLYHVFTICICWCGFGLCVVILHFILLFIMQDILARYSLWWTDSKHFAHAGPLFLQIPTAPVVWITYLPG